MDNRQLHADVMESLPKFLMHCMSENEISIYEGDFCDDNDDLYYQYYDKGDKAPWKNEENMLCCVCQLSQKDFKAFSDVRYIHTYAGGGMDNAGNRIGNIITYVNKKKPDHAVSYQIIGRSAYSTVEMMLEDLGTKSFGFSVKDGKYLIRSQKTLEYFGFPLEPYALRVVKLPYPVLKPDDISAYW